MKVRIIACIVLFLTGCSILSDQDKNKLTGSWNWVSSQGGFAGWTLTPESTGYTQTLTFYEDRTYTITKDGDLQKQGTYEILLIEYDGSKKLAIQYDSLEFYYAIIMELTDTLHLQENCYDCYSHIYVRSE